MKFIYVAVSLGFLSFSCSKDKTTSPSFSDARYLISVTGKWNSPEFTVPAGAHFTTFAGMIHNGNAFLWKEGMKASAGTELLAETGGVATMLTEIDSMIAAKNALALILFVAPSATGIKNGNIFCNSNYSYVSFASMLGPTPDWFTGISDINLYNSAKWVADTIINLYTYDAGTEDGDVLGSSNPPTVPQQNIHVLTVSQATALANGNPIMAPIATVRFTKQ